MNKKDIVVAELKGVKVEFGNQCIRIVNSYQVKDDEEKIKILKGILILHPEIKDYRTLENMLTEWKAHNILFQHKYQRARTKDVDFEYKQSKWHGFIFKLITAFMREKV